MAFNPLNFQLKRETGGVKRRHNYIQLQPSTTFGRSSNSDVKLVSRKCSKKQCVIVFRDGKPFISDFSTNGTFVNGVQVETETTLSENDKISLGTNLDGADIQKQDTYVFSVIRQEVVELDDSDEEDVQMVEAPDSGKAPDKDHKDGNNGKVAQGNAEPDAQEHSNQPSTSQRLANAPIPEIAQLQQLKEKQENLRHWNMPKPPIIEPLPMKRGRQKQQPVPGPSEESLPKKRGRPPKDRKEKLAAIVKPVDEKPSAPKPKRNLKIKITKDNRGAFLSVPIEQDSISNDT